MSLAKASTASWASKSTQSPTGSEETQSKGTEVCQAWSRSDWPLNKGRNDRPTPRYTNRNQEWYMSLGVSSYV